jgi:hypothetical protein
VKASVLPLMKRIPQGIATAITFAALDGGDSVGGQQHPAVAPAFGPVLSAVEIQLEQPRCHQDGIHGRAKVTRLHLLTLKPLLCLLLKKTWHTNAWAVGTNQLLRIRLPFTLILAKYIFEGM